MGKVTLKIPPFFSYVMLPGFSDWFIQEREIGDKTSVCDLLNEIAAANPVFRGAVYNPDDRTLYDGINVILNQKLLNSSLEMSSKLNDGDVIVLLPSLAGG
ncbi:MAG TPA: MoaD/ThiS family protein [Dehalococcoidales bacterium]|jgi:molybdopterin converting factor small subunit|nr:MoaD/ThiS family protein [Dehalococcoidales bacterium]